MGDPLSLRFCITHFHKWHTMGPPWHVPRKNAYFAALANLSTVCPQNQRPLRQNRTGSTPPSFSCHIPAPFKFIHTSATLNFVSAPTWAFYRSSIFIHLHVFDCKNASRTRGAHLNTYLLHLLHTSKCGVRGVLKQKNAIYTPVYYLRTLRKFYAN